MVGRQQPSPVMPTPLHVWVTLLVNEKGETFRYCYALPAWQRGISAKRVVIVEESCRVSMLALISACFRLGLCHCIRVFLLWYAFARHGFRI